MRFQKHNIPMEDGAPVTGSVLIAHPMLRDPHFRRTVIFLASHDPQEGSLGVVMNRSMHRTLGSLKPEAADSPLADIPLYEGGPVASDQLVLAAWRWCGEEASLQFYFGIDSAKAQEFLENDDGFQVRAFMGHAGWGEGQLDFEMAQQSWVLSPWVPQLMGADGEAPWRGMLLRVNPTMRLLMDAPEDPSRN
jgi:putative transcriptional regulator